jgi:hypothetical protein
MSTTGAIPWSCEVTGFAENLAGPSEAPDLQPARRRTIQHASPCSRQLNFACYSANALKMRQRGTASSGASGAAAPKQSWKSSTPSNHGDCAGVSCACSSLSASFRLDHNCAISGVTSIDSATRRRRSCCRWGAASCAAWVLARKNHQFDENFTGDSFPFIAWSAGGIWPCQMIP